MFEKAAKLKLRFDTAVGPLSVEDLWDLPLVATTKRGVDLDSIAVALDKQIRETSTTSFVKKVVRDTEHLKLKFDIVLRVIEVKQAEAEAAETKKVNAEKKQHMLELLAKKQDEALASKSVEELQTLIAAL